MSKNITESVKIVAKNPKTHAKMRKTAGIST